jgi:cytochrome b561
LSAIKTYTDHVAGEHGVPIEVKLMAWNAKNRREGRQPRPDQCRLSALTIEAGRYTLAAQALHWLTVFLILMILPVAWVMMSLPEGPEQSRMLVVHRSLGVTIFAVAVLRLAWRPTHPAPPLPSDTPRVMQWISQLTHWLLYALLLLMPITGYLQSGDGRPVSYFGLFDLPALPKDKALGDVAKVLHLLGQWGVYTLVGLHVGATVWHVAIRRDGLLNRMIPPQDQSGALR